MAININDVYQTVLVITNKDNRGYITPCLLYTSDAADE